jgi:uncharacterized protein YutD
MDPQARQLGIPISKIQGYVDKHCSVGCDILVTHGPPRFHLDVDGFGDEFLLKEL